MGGWKFTTRVRMKFLHTRASCIPEIHALEQALERELSRYALAARAEILQSIAQAVIFKVKVPPK